MPRTNDKTEIMAFRVSPKMKQKIMEAATSEGMTVPDWFRYIVVREIKYLEKSA